MPEPFMEHPTGDFNSAVSAMADAIGRLRSLPSWEQWITFGAQGEGQEPDCYESAEIRMRDDRLDVGVNPLDISRVIQDARTRPGSLIPDGEHYSVAAASPREVAQILRCNFSSSLWHSPICRRGR
jgi:hypothetical protein